jgi:prepilin-type N-terminal cleavage/methylation domain-containing protein
VYEWFGFRRKVDMKKKSRSAFTLVEILIVVAILTLIAAISVPALLDSYNNSLTRIRQTNVDIVEAAKEQWALLNNATNGTPVVEDDIIEYVGRGILSLDELNVNGAPININHIGTPASY